MNILLGGASGLVGTALQPALSEAGHTVRRLVRREPVAGEVRWDPTAGSLDPAALVGVDAVVHLGGESLAAGRWTAQRKERLRSSRIDSTRLLAKTIAGLEHQPETFVVASAIGWYGDRGDEVLTEESEPGSGFLAELCRDWEAAAAPAVEAGVRVVHLRLGVVFAAEGGALPKMLLPFKLGAGGPVGSGRQYLSWVALEDVGGAILHVLATPVLSGPVNVTAPGAVTNGEFTKVAGKVLHRPTLAKVPAFVLRLMMGEMADELLLASTRVEPRRLLDSGYAFRFAAVEDALRFLLGRPL